MRIQPNATNQSVYFFVIDGDGAPVPSATINSGMTDILAWYQTGPTSAPVDEALLLLAASTTAHTDNYGRAIAPGIIRVDYPDSLWASGAANVRLWLDLTTVNADYAVAGGFVDVQMGYALQQPDSGSTKLALDIKSDAIIAAAAGLATQATVNTISSQLTTVDTVVDAILVDTDATIPGLLSTIDTVVDSILVDTDATIPGLLATIDTVVDAVLVDTGTTLPAQIDGISVGAASAGTTYQRYRTHETTVLDMGGSTVVTPTDAPDYPAAYVGSVIKIGAFTTTIVAWFPDEVEMGEPTVPGYYQIADSLAVQAEGTAITIYGDVQAAVELAIAEKLPAGATLIAGAGAEAETLDEVTGGGGGGTTDAEDIAPDRTWDFPKSGNRIVSGKTVPLAASQAGSPTVCFDLNNLLETNVVVSSVSTPTITGTAATVGTPVIHTSYRKVNIPLSSVTATPGRYLLTMAFVATDSEPYTVKGYLQVE